MNIFVAKLNYATDSESVRKAFEQFGEVESANVVTDRETGRSKGFAFVEMPDDTEGNAAIQALDGTDLDGRTIVVKKAEPRENRGSGGGGFNGGGGGRLRLYPLGLSLAPVVVAASRWRQSATNLPVLLARVSSATVALLNPQTTADLLGLTGQVFVQKSQQGGGSPLIRGFATNRLLYAVDGVRMNTAIFRSGNLQNVISLDPFSLENTEIIFGPGSVSYGSDAIGAVLSFQTLSPRLAPPAEHGAAVKTRFFGRVLSRYATANQEKTAHVNLNFGGKRWALLTSLSWFDFGHLRQGRHGLQDYLKPYFVQRQDSVDRVIYSRNDLIQIPSAYRQFNGLQKFRFQPNARWDFQYAFHYSETSAYGRYDRHQRLRDGAPRYAEWDYGPQTWLMNHWQFTHTATTAIYDAWTLRLAHQVFGESRIERNFNQVIRSQQTEAVTAWSVNLDARKAYGQRRLHLLSYGLEAVSNAVTSTGVLTDITTRASLVGPARYPQADWATAAFFINNSLRFKQGLSVLAGARYSAYQLEAQFDTSFYPFPFTAVQNQAAGLTASLGLNQALGSKLRFRANFGTAFRAPNVDDSGKVFDASPGTVTVPNPQLQAETARNLDFGLGWQIGSYGHIEITAYHTWLTNALVNRSFTFNGQDSIWYNGTLSQVRAIQNAALLTVSGVQISLGFDWTTGLNWALQFNYQSGREQLDLGGESPLRHAAPAFGLLRLGYRWGALTTQAYLNYQVKRDFDELPEEEQSKIEIYARDVAGRPFSPAWYTLNWKTNCCWAQSKSGLWDGGLKT
ncbi:MAG: TonB-dependent receptor [Lewinella sp.]|nr:TonB-dependent receptor [Lewinella sp.]